MSVCPGSSAATHAKVEMHVQANVACSYVREEILARVTSATWIDPHNGGSYNVMNQTSVDHLLLSRVTGSGCRGCYTDHIGFAFAELPAIGACNVVACSESPALTF